MMETTITATELSDRLLDVLERVKERGERFVVQRNGEVVATIAPPSAPPGATLRELAAELAHLPPLDDDFGADIEAVRAWLGPAKVPEWPE